MPITSEQYREALRHFPSGVTIVTIKAGDRQHGLTVSAFASVSPEPPPGLGDDRSTASCLRNPGDRGGGVCGEHPAPGA